MNNNDNDDVDNNDKLKNQPHLKLPTKDDETKKQQLALPSFIDEMFEIPDPKLLAGELLFILMINFLLK